MATTSVALVSCIGKQPSQCGYLYPRPVNEGYGVVLPRNRFCVRINGFSLKIAFWIAGFKAIDKVCICQGKRHRFLLLLPS